ncbi:hypothetical protein FRC06_005181 [Ceratobasidium sp. 370]|nr:hypothetical protein FRC06_005181 [Ceratobasidium sp. 370]
MASLFRSNQPRSPQQPPPSSFKRSGPAALAVAVSSADRAHRRVSRTQDDFEAALRGEDTMVLQEGRDIRSLGVHDTPSRARSGSIASVKAQTAPGRASTDTIPVRRQTVSTPKHTARPAPATPAVIPPTPSTVTQTPTAPEDAQEDEDEEYNARRRSMFRSPGTASSPDLATLVRKVRDAREQMQDFLDPAPPADRVRTKSSTSSAFEFVESSPVQTPLKQPARDRALTSPDQGFDGSPRLRKSQRRLAKAEKVLGVSRVPVSNDPAAALASDIGEGRSDREGKRSMRNKTSAFFGKMLGHGQSSVRDRSHGGHSTPTTPIATQHYTYPAPPVPAIPVEYRQTNQASSSSAQSPFVDAQYTESPTHTPPFSDSDPFNNTSAYSNPMPLPRHSKPLPPIYKQFPPVPVDDRSDSDDDVPLAAPGPVPRPKTSMDAGRVGTDHDRNATLTQRRPRPTTAFPRQGKDGRRRSMSVGDIDVQKLVMEARARAAERGEQPRSSGLGKQEPRGSMDVRTRETPPRASLDTRLARYEPEPDSEDEDRTEEGHAPSSAPLPMAPESPLDQRRMSKRAQAVHAWSRDMDLSRLVDGFGGELQDALGGIRGSPYKAQLGGAGSAPSGGKKSYSTRPHTTERTSSDGTAGASGRGLGIGVASTRGQGPIPPSPLAARRPSTTSVASASSSSMLAVPGRYIHSSSSNVGHGQGLASHPSMESMRTVSSETAGTYITPPSSGILEFNPTLPSPGNSNSAAGSQSLPTPTLSSSIPTAGALTAPAPSGSSVQGSSPTSSSLPSTPLSTSLPPRSSSLRLSPRALPRRQPPRHRSVASASEPSLVDPVGHTASVRLVSEQLPARPAGTAAAAINEQRLVSDPVIPASGWAGDDVAVATSKADRRGSVGGASMDIEGRGQSLAARCWQEDESFLVKEKIAEWLGGTPAINKVALRYYMDYFDFSGMRLDSAFRHLCTKLYLKAETQQVDRILEEFSRRFWDCNRGSIYGSPWLLYHADFGASVPTEAIVHAISYSLLLLNTDLHIAELSSHMSKTQFVRNTWAVIQDQIRSLETAATRSPMSGTQALSSGPGSGSLAQSSASSSAEPVRSPMSFEHGRAHISQDQIRSPAYLPGESTPELVLDDESSQPGDVVEPVTRAQRSGSLNSWRSGSKETVPTSLNASNPSVTMEGSDPKTPTGSMYQVVFARGWDSEMEVLLKDMYTAVKNQQILQPLTGLVPSERQSMSLSPGMTGIGRTRSQRGQVASGGDREGMLCRKQYWESAGKRAKAKTWMDVFVVIQKGELSMFVFGESSSSTGGDTVGGGNWLAGTEDLVNEWVMTCNYWAARQSKEPLSGGVSNMEYGWNRALELLQNSKEAPAESRMDASDARSVRSGRAGNLRIPPSPYNSERIVIYDWTGPMHSVMPSTHDEETQMEALQKQANLLKRELHVHNELRQPMMSLYLPRSANATKASNNWERRSQYLLSEIVKYDSYVDSLRSAMSQRLKRRGEKALERALGASSPDEELAGVVYGAPAITGSGPSGRHDLNMNSMRATSQQVIHEDEEPSTPLPVTNSFSTRY